MWCRLERTEAGQMHEWIRIANAPIFLGRREKFRGRARSIKTTGNQKIIGAYLAGCWIGGRKDGWMDRWMGEWVDGWMDWKEDLLDKTNIMMRRWNHNVILFRGISRFLSAVCRRWFPGQSGDRTCLVLYKRLVMCFARPFQLLPSACTSDIPLTLSWKFSHHLPSLRPATVYIFL